jgi:hypothetical protein
MEKRNVFKLLFLYFVIVATLSACNSSTTKEKTGSLELTVIGLTGVDASVSVIGPKGFNQTLKASGKLENLSVGNYTITAQDIVQTNTYFPDKRQQSVEVKAGEMTNVTLTYSKQDVSAGSLEVTINGLPVGTNADVVISGLNGFSQQLTTSSVLSNVTPGDYQLTAKVVKVGGDSYAPTATNQTIAVAAGSNTDVSVTYTKQSVTVGQLAITVTGLPNDVIASSSLTGPNGFSKNVTGSETLDNLQPGTYTLGASQRNVVYPYNPLPKTQSINVVAGEAATARIVYVPTIPLPHEAEDAAFGFNVAVDGDIMVVGAPFETSGNVQQVGFAYVYMRVGRSEWQFLKQLAAPMSLENDNFGISVAVSGDRIVVGSPNALTNRTCDLNGNCIDQRGGAVYVFERNQGGQNNFGLVAPLRASDFYGDSDDFGNSVAISGKVVVIGARGKAVDLNKDGTIDCATTYTECGVGEAYLFEEAEETKTWREIKTLYASDGASSDDFGADVSMSGDTVFVGKPGDDRDATKLGTGAAYIFQRNQGGADNWGEVKKLVASDGVSYDYFGETVAISGDLAVVGIFSEAERSEATAYVFGRNHGGTNNWAELKTLKVATVPGYLYAPVVVRGDTVLVGVPYASHDVNEDGKVECLPGGMSYAGSECFVGAVSVFGRNEGGANNFGLVKRFLAADGAGNDGLGYGLALSENTIVAGAPGHDKRTGAVYVLE